MTQEDSDFQLAFARLSRLNDLVAFKASLLAESRRVVELADFEALCAFLSVVTAEFRALQEPSHEIQVERTLKKGTCDEVRKWLLKDHGYTKEQVGTIIDDYMGSANETFDIWTKFRKFVTSYKVVSS